MKYFRFSYSDYKIVRKKSFTVNTPYQQQTLKKQQITFGITTH